MLVTLGDPPIPAINVRVRSLFPRKRRPLDKVNPVLQVNAVFRLTPLVGLLIVSVLIEAGSSVPVLIKGTAVPFPYVTLYVTPVRLNDGAASSEPLTFVVVSVT